MNITDDELMERLRDKISMMSAYDILNVWDVKDAMLHEFRDEIIDEWKEEKRQEEADRLEDERQALEDSEDE